MDDNQVSSQLTFLLHGLHGQRRVAPQPFTSERNFMTWYTPMKQLSKAVLPIRRQLSEGN
jgi:hypothetical protein